MSNYQEHPIGQEIAEFQKECEENAYTDTERAQELLTAAREALADLYLFD